MKTHHPFIYGLFFLLCAQGCISPMNMAYDNAAPLSENQLSIAAAYNFSEEGMQINEDFDLVNNYMVRLGYGLNEISSLYLGYYHKDERIGDSDLFDPTDYAYAAYDYFDFGAKFSIAKDRSFAIKILGGGYLVDRELVAYSLYGSLIYTYYPKSNDNFELSFIGHGTGVYERNGIQLLPGLNIGAGFSADFNKWAIRPEIGFNWRTVTAGIGLELKLGQQRPVAPEK